MVEEDEGESREAGWARVVRLAAGVSAGSVGGGLERFMHKGESVERARAKEYEQQHRVDDASEVSSSTSACERLGAAGVSL